MRVAQLVGQPIVHEIGAADRPEKGRDASQFPALATRMGIQDAHSAAEVEARHLERAPEVAVVADHQGRLEGPSVGEIDEIDREADIRALLAGDLDLDRSAAKVGWSRHEAATPRLDQRSEMDLASSDRLKGAQMGMLRRGQSRIEPTIEE